MNPQVDIQSACSEPAPDEEDIRRWIAAALSGQERDETEISLRLVGEAEMSRLNRDYRGVDGPTNVLSFPAEFPGDIDLPLLGDIVICSPVVIAEAADQGKALSAHWAHMVVHGTLHLLGYDHVEEGDAAAMESLESEILRRLGYPCPYRVEPPRERATG